MHSDCRRYEGPEDIDEFGSCRSATVAHLEEFPWMDAFPARLSIGMNSPGDLVTIMVVAVAVVDSVSEIVHLHVLTFDAVCKTAHCAGWEDVPVGFHVLAVRIECDADVEAGSFLQKVVTVDSWLRLV